MCSHQGLLTFRMWSLSVANVYYECMSMLYIAAYHLFILLWHYTRQPLFNAVVSPPVLWAVLFFGITRYIQYLITKSSVYRYSYHMYCCIPHVPDSVFLYS